MESAEANTRFDRLEELAKISATRKLTLEELNEAVVLCTAPGTIADLEAWLAGQ